MRTKVLLGAAAMAAGLATSAMAQSNVYSLNVVGYYNVVLAANQKLLIANQLNTTNNTIASVLPSSMVSDGSQFFKYSGGFQTYQMDFLNTPPAWDGPLGAGDGSATLNPGEGGFFVSQNPTTLTFVGTVLQGSLTNTLPINTKVIRSSIVPQQGGVTTVLGLPAEDPDQLFTYSAGYQTFQFDSLNTPPSWDGPLGPNNEPVIGVGQAFFYVKAASSVSSSWVRNFTVQ